MESAKQLVEKITPSQQCVQFYGVDVSKNELVIAQVLEDNQYARCRFANSENGIADFIASIEDPSHTLVVLEATGTYSLNLVFALAEARIPTTVLNPKQSKGFISGVLLSITKTDDRDACALALYGKVNRPPLYEFPDDKALEIRQLRNLLNRYKKQKLAAQNHLHALEFHPKPCDFVLQELQENVQYLEEKISLIQSKLCDLSKEAFEELYDLAISVTGLGPSTVTAMLVHSNGCKDFQNAKQLVKFFGVAPSQKESGISLKSRGAISKTGPNEVRALLYLCARSAKRFNPECKDLYERLRSKGKCHKVAMTAVSAKLVRQFFGVIKSGLVFEKDFQLKKKAALAAE